MILEKQRAVNINRFELPRQMELTEDFVKGYMRLAHLYRGAMMEVSTKLEILDDEFSVTYDHNPIHHMECRLKTAESTVNKLRRKGYDVNTQNIMEHIQDVAGVRVICSYTDDIYRLARVIEKHRDFTLLRRTDYIAEPKENGYRSLHLVIEVPVTISEVVLRLPVEIQLRTIAMDMWASLEHELHYKSNKNVSPEATEELRLCAQQLSDIDAKMQEISRSISAESR
ncbi:MAG: GTP pyrophosphokinase [Candidatus Heteroscillospira sp.]|jgi:putative GTP pyrophosphokinase